MRVHAQVGADNRLHVDQPVKSGGVHHPLDARSAGTSNFEPDAADFTTLGAFHVGDEQVQRLRVIAAKCPIHRTLDGEVMFSERLAFGRRRTLVRRFVITGLRRFATADFLTFFAATFFFAMCLTSLAGTADASTPAAIDPA